MSEIGRTYRTNMKLKMQKAKDVDFVERSLGADAVHCRRVSTCQPFAGKMLKCCAVDDCVNKNDCK